MVFRLDPSQRRRGESPVIMAPVLAPDQCRRVIELASALPAAEGRIGEAGVDPSLRSSTIRWLPQDAVFSSLYEAIAGALFGLNQHFFGYELTTIEDIQFTTYVDAAKGFYDWHPDAGLNPRDDTARKLSLTVQLSEPTDYDGGELELWCDREPVTARKEQGLGVAFPAPTLHRIRPVSRGRRHSLVAWASGPRFR
jgi:PKHD-type hydroxylase